MMTMTGVSVSIKCHWFHSGQHVEVSMSKTTKESKILLLKQSPVYESRGMVIFNVSIKGYMRTCLGWFKKTIF